MDAAQQTTAHQEAFTALLTDCSLLRFKAEHATSYREQCRKLGTRADELMIAARVASSHVRSGEASWCLVKAFSHTHNLVSEAVTLIDMHGMYSRPKKYIKIAFNAAASHRGKLVDQLALLSAVNDELWDIAEQVGVRAEWERSRAGVEECGVEGVRAEWR